VTRLSVGLCGLQLGPVRSQLRCHA
jgi:hypothetical protein